MIHSGQGSHPRPRRPPPAHHASTCQSNTRSPPQHCATHLATWRAAGAQQAAAMVIRRNDLAVLASIGSAAWSSPRRRHRLHPGSPRSPGSTLKPFLYALALDRGVLDTRP